MADAPVAPKRYDLVTNCRCGSSIEELIDKGDSMIRFVLVFVLFLGAFGVQAQQPSTDRPAAQALAVPKLDDDDLTLLSTLRALLQVANRDCNNLDSVKLFNAQKNVVTARIEKKYAGFTLNDNGNALIAKVPMPPAGR